MAVAAAIARVAPEIGNKQACTLFAKTLVKPFFEKPDG